MLTAATTTEWQMKYQIKPRINESPVLMDRHEVEAAAANGSLAASSLMREARQDFWYSVGEWIGSTPTPSFRYRCGKCKHWMVARKIDVGLPCRCDACLNEAIVPDTQVAQQRVANADLPKIAQQWMLGGGAVAALGLLTSFLSFRAAGDRGGGVYYLFYGLILVGGLSFLKGFSLKRSFDRSRKGRP